MRLIDADALKEKAYSVTVKNEWHMHTSIDVVDTEDIDTAPTIDAVHVVRCKDCKHYEYSDRLERLMCGYHRGWRIGMNENDYCSYGERKDND